MRNGMNNRERASVEWFTGSLTRKIDAQQVVRTNSPREARVIGIVQSIDPKAPRRRLVNSDGRMVRRVSFK